jgi:hypothetical protein
LHNHFSISETIKKVTVTSQFGLLRLSEKTARVELVALSNQRAREKEPKYLGEDFHPEFQQIAAVDGESGVPGKTATVL